MFRDVISDGTSWIWMVFACSGGIVAAMVAPRLFLAFPWAAISTPVEVLRPMEDSWRCTRGNGWALMIVVWAIVIPLEGAGILAYFSLLESDFPIWLVFGIVGGFFIFRFAELALLATVLSIAFCHLTDFRSDDVEVMLKEPNEI
jgi:hypothetical protein